MFELGQGSNRCNQRYTFFDQSYKKNNSRRRYSNTRGRFYEVNFHRFLIFSCCNTSKFFFLNDNNFNSFKSTLCRCGHISEVKQFNAWLGTLPHKHKIVIAGNHELSFDETFTTKGDMDVTKDIGHRTSHTGDSIGRSSRYTIRFHCISLYLQ